jgi:hypothetical protein
MTPDEKILQLEKDLASTLLATRSEEIDERKLDFMRRHGMLKTTRRNIPKTEEARAYLEKLKGNKKDVTMEGYSEIELKKAVVYYAELEAAKKGQSFVWDDKVKKVYRNLLYYFANDPRCLWDLQKGLCFYGATGVGKTMSFKVFQNFIVNTVPDSKKRFKMATCIDVFKSYARGQESAIEEYTLGNWCFDDMGAEEASYKHYGNDVNVMEQVFFYRDKEREKGYQNTLITTNLDTIEIEERYGTRIYDRLRQMVTFIQITGESKRK